MARLAVAAAALATLLLSFVATVLLTGERSEPAAPPRAAAAPQPAEDAGPADPAPAPTREGAEGPPASGSPSRATLQELARAADEAEEAVRRSLLEVPDSRETTVEHKLDAYRSGLRDALEGSPIDDPRRHRGMLTEVFLRMEAVQRDLAALDPGSRASALAHIRREMGFDEEEVARLRERDERRNERWRNGLEYMEARERVTGTFEGEARKEEVRALRERYFGPEAETIAREERQGFFRYERPRVYGRN